MKTFLRVLLVGFAIYVFFLMISSINFKGMNFSEIKLIISICAGIAISFVSSSKGEQFIHSALEGFISGVIIYALILWFTQNVF